MSSNAPVTGPVAPLAIHLSPISFTSQLLKGGTVGPSSQSTLAASLQTLNVETLQILKTKLAQQQSPNTTGADASTNTKATQYAAAAGGSSRATSLPTPDSFTWLNFQKSQLPPSGNASSNPDLAAIKSLHAAFLQLVHEVCDDDRNSTALAETGGIVYRALKRQLARQEEATAVAQAAQTTTESGADNYAVTTADSQPPPASPALLLQLKNIAADAKKEIDRAIGGSVSQVQVKKLIALIQQMDTLIQAMQAKYDQLRLLRELKNMSSTTTANASSTSSSSAGHLFIPAPKDNSLPALPLLDQEFGFDLPIMADEDHDPPDLAASPLASKPVRGVIQQLRDSMSRMGLAPAKPKADKPLLSLTPMDESDDVSTDDFLSDDDDLYVGESEDDDDEREQIRLASLNQSTRVIHDAKSNKKSSSTTYTSAAIDPSELPTSPVGWWSWLVGVCDPFVTFNDAGIPVLSASDLAQQLLGILQTSKPDVQNELLDTVGFSGLDLLPVLIKYRKELKSITPSHQAQARASMEQKEKERAQAAVHAISGGKADIRRNLIGISINSASDLEYARNRKRADRRHARRSAREEASDARFQIDESKLDEQANLLKSRISANASQVHSQLPAGTTRMVHKDKDGKPQYEEVVIPPVKKPEINESELLPIEASFEPFAQQAFPRTKTLNRIQSRVYESAYHHNNNLLICAPTGAGKTNVAMMCVLREIGQHIVNGVLQKDMFKMVYVAPMKALAQEVQATFQARLAPLGIIVKELTGDMQLTKKELKETQLIVTTPEKWDVVTRKNGSDSGSGGTGLMSLVKLLIIDECHLLNEDRGPVLEILVARTLRLVETSQQMCRIVGLSATLPNYQDVAVFLKAGVKDGLFHFDASYRPVPLEQKFIGVLETNQVKRLTAMNEICYKKVIESVRVGNQVMVFVHSRRDTYKTAKFLMEKAAEEKTLPFFDMSKDPAYSAFEKKMMRSRNTELHELFPYGFAMHHAGMVRPDRSLVEAAFTAGLIKVLVCTATLAWGVNLPAHTVCLKGTQIYNAEKGGFMDVGMLDIMQIFGRAGRPQFDDSGEAILICEHDKLPRYLSLLTHQLPIESQFIKELPNHLNAEIILGTVTNLHEAVEWLSYTYLYTRMLRNPMVYGISYDDMKFDELLIAHRQNLIIEAAKMLMRCRMIKFDQKSGQFYSTDVGRVASHYYLHYESIELYNTLLQPVMTDEDILHLLASSKEFQQIKVRDEEVAELSKLMKKYAPHKLKGGFEAATGKQNLLLQCYISNAIIDAPTLISDSYFIQQSAGRICRALFEMTLKRGRAFLASKFLTYAKCIEQKIWEFQTPLRQFLTGRDRNDAAPGSGGGQTGGLLKMPMIQKIEEKNLKLDALVEMDANEIGSILKHNTMGHTIKQCLSYIPYLSVEAKIQPITRTVLKIDMELTPEFTWNDRQHGQMESFWIWIEDTNNEHIYHSENLLLHKKQMNEVHKLTFTIPIFEPLPPQYYIKIVSDRWMGSENVHALNFKHLILPELYPANTALLDLHPLPRSALMNSAFERLYTHKFTHFNPIQTQIFHTLYHTDENVLLGAPTGSGKTIVAELSMLRLFSMYPGQKVVYIAPLKALARERIDDWTSEKSFKGILNKKIVELTGDTAPDQQAIIASDIIITTPEKWDGISRQWSTRSYVKKVGLVIIDEIHLLGADRGPVLEVIVSRMRYISSHTASPIRIVGLSTALSNAKDLGDWLGIERAGLFNFPPSVRPVPLTIHIAGYSGKHYCPRMATMNKPTYAAIQTHSPNKPVLVFVSSRRQTRLTALDLIAFSAADGDPRKWLHLNEAQLQNVLNQISDPNLRHMISFGIGMHHAGLASKDRQIVEKLFLELKIQVLVCTSTLAWGVNFPAHCVIVKGTEYYDAKVSRYVDFPITDVLQMIGRAGRPQFDSEAKAVVLVHEPKKNYYLNFLHSPFPVESSLLVQLHDHINAEICASGTIKSISDFLDYLSWTFFFRRLLLNPSYYGLEDTTADVLNKFLMELVTKVLTDLTNAGLILQDEDTQKLVPLTLGKISAFYYLKYQTMIVFSERLRPDARVQDLLEVLSEVKEYEELPVRHNEDKMNQEMIPAMRWPINEAACDSPFTKAHILFQAHLSRLDLPISDYYTDLKSVLDQAIRVLQAMIDTTTEAGWLSTTLNAMNLMQMVVQGRWADDSTLLNLPGVQENEKLRSTLRNERLGDLSTIIAADRKKVEQVIRRCNMGEDAVSEFMDMLARLPVIQSYLSASYPSSGATAANGVEPFSKSPPSKTPINLPAGSTFTITVHLHRTNPNTNIRILTPVFSKPKDEAWWVVVGLSPSSNAQRRDGHHLEAGGQDELVALKRVMGLKNKQHININIQLPYSVGQHYYTVYLVSDSYLGLDQRLPFTVNATATNAHTSSSSSTSSSTTASATASSTDPNEDDYIYT